MTMIRKTLTVAGMMVIAACSTGPDYSRPAPPSAGQIAFVTPSPGATVQAAPDPDWWRIYNDPSLDALVERALAANTELRVALANLRAAQAITSETRNARLPQTNVTGQGNYGQRQAPFFQPDAQFGGTLGFDLSYEVDLFGRVSRTIEAARADAEAEAYAHKAVRVRIVAQVTNAYMSVCTASEAIRAARSSIDLTAESVRIIRLQERAGSAALLDVARAESQLAEARAALPTLENARLSSLYQLAALLGLPPTQAPQSAAACTAAPEPSGPIPIGDIEGLLQRRPDVAEAERRLAAQSARIGVATADLYPRIRIGGSVSQAVGEGLSLSDGFSFGFGPLLNFSFPNDGAARARVRQAEARAEAALATFDGVVLNAMSETEQALSAYASASRRRDELRIAVQRLEQALDLANRRYRAGSIAYLDVLVAQSELIRARLTLADQQRTLASSLVTLFRSLGGGWEGLPPSPR